MKGLRLFAVISSSQIGGSERCFAALLEGLRERGVAVSLAFDGAGPMSREYRGLASRSWSIDLSNPFAPAVVRRLSSLMREDAPDLVHTHLWNADFLGGLAARHAGIRPAVSTVYGAYHLPIGIRGTKALKRRALSRTYRGVYRLFDHIIATSQFVRDDLVSRPGLRARPGAISVIHPGIAFTPAADGVEAQSTSIICVANFHPIKGHAWLLRALPRIIEVYPELDCLFAGDGPYRPEMERLAKRLGLGSHVRFAGTLPEPFDTLRAGVFVLPSESEGLSMALLEALARGIPVVATRVGAIPEALEHGQTGLLVPPRDPKALAAAIIALLSDAALKRRLASAGREMVKSRFSQDRTLDATLAVYAEALARRPGGA